MTDTVRSRRTRRLPPQRDRLPVTIRWGVPLAVLAVIAYVAWGTWQSRYAYLRIADAGDVAGKLEFFVFDESGAALSPPPKIGEVEFEGPGPHAIGPELVPGAALVRISAPKHGQSFVFAESGVTRLTELGAPTTTWGRTVRANGDPVAGARVQALGGGPHGVLLSETVSGDDGRWELGGLASSLDTIEVRVLAPGFAVAESRWWLEGEQPRDVTLAPTETVRGTVVAPPGVDVGELRVQAFQLPGVFCATAPDGTFELDHLLPLPASARLVVPTLPPGFTHRRTNVQAGDRDVRIEVLRAGAIEGRVVLAATGQPVPGSSVQHDYGPHGVEVAWCDDDGRFRIGRVPPGPVVLHAGVPDREPTKKGRPGRPRWRGGRVTLTLDEGEIRRDVTIELD